MNKASDIYNSLTPSLGAAGAREVALAAVEKGHAENDLAPAAAIDHDVITEVIKSLAEASVAAPAGTTPVQVAHSAKPAAGAEADPDIDVVVAQVEGKVDGLNTKVDNLTVYLNKSFGMVAKILDLMQKGVGAVDRRVLEQGTQVQELAKSLGTRQAPKATTGRVEAQPNLQDRAATEEVAATGKELANRLHLQREINVEIQKSQQLEIAQPKSQQARLKVLSEAALMLTRPIPSEQIAAHVQIQLPA